MERLRKIEADFKRIRQEEKDLRTQKLELRDRAREAGLKLDFINNKITSK